MYRPVPGAATDRPRRRWWRHVTGSLDGATSSDALDAPPWWPTAEGPVCCSRLAQMQGVAMSLFAVTTAKGPNWRHDRSVREQPGWDDHAAFADALVDQGVVVLGGPISSENDEEVGLLAVEADSEAAVRSIFSQDPWATSGVLRIANIRSWTIWLDGRPR